MSLFNFGKKQPATAYFAHLDSIFKKEPLIYQEESLTPGIPGVVSFVYENFPSKGHITGVTYGLSLVDHPAWKFGRPELCIAVKSDQLAWARVAGYIANNLRGDCPFTYGQHIRFGQKVSDDSEMDAFFIFAPEVLDRDEYLGIDIGLDYKINIAGLYPMYGEELAVYEEIGCEGFLQHEGFDGWDVGRGRIVGAK